MKICLPSDKGWYVAVGAIILPIAVMYIIQPIWLARMIGIGMYYIFAPLALLGFVLYRSMDYFAANSSLYVRFHKKKVDTVARIVVSIFAIFLLYSMFLPYMLDVIHVVRDGAPLSARSYVERTRVGSLTGLIMEEVVVDSPVATSENTYTAYFFPPRYIVHKNTYEFYYLPHSRVILDAKLVN